MDINEMMAKLKETLSEARFQHSLNVMKDAVKLAELYKADKARAEIAGLLHDCAKGMSREQLVEICEANNIKTDEIMLTHTELLHALVGAVVAKNEYHIDDEEILDAIRTHTTGCANMTLLQKIIFIADVIEQSRDFNGVDEIRQKAFEDLDEALVMAFDSIITFILKKGLLLHTNTVTARNSIIIKKHVVSIK